eukprot:12081919-Alexandrium_andersonii.AAC.1
MTSRGTDCRVTDCRSGRAPAGARRPTTASNSTVCGLVWGVQHGFARCSQGRQRNRPAGAPE